MRTRTDQTARRSPTLPVGSRMKAADRGAAAAPGTLRRRARKRPSPSPDIGQLDWRARAPDRIARVLLDGVLVAEVDTYKPTEEIQANVYSASGLAAANHTLTIEATGLKNAASTDTYIVVDAFDANSNYNVTTAVTATGPANVYWREFERGYVYVNPSPTTCLGDSAAGVRQLTHDNLNSPRDSIPNVSAISLNSHHAAILLKTLARFEQTSRHHLHRRLGRGWNSRPWSAAAPRTLRRRARKRPSPSPDVGQLDWRARAPDRDRSRVAGWSARCRGRYV